MNQHKMLNIDYDKSAKAYMEIHTEGQKISSLKEIRDYLIYLTDDNVEYATELVRRIKSDDKFEDLLISAVMQISALVTSMLFEGLLKYDNTFKEIKERSHEEYDDVRKFKQYMLNNVSVQEIEKHLGMSLSKEMIVLFEKRYAEVRAYFFQE